MESPQISLNRELPRVPENVSNISRQGRTSIPIENLNISSIPQIKEVYDPRLGMYVSTLPRDQIGTSIVTRSPTIEELENIESKDYLGSLKPIKEVQTYGELSSIYFPKLVPSIKEKVSDFTRFTPEGRILKDIGKESLSMTKKLKRKEIELELRLRDIPITEENIKNFEDRQREFVRKEIDPFLELVAIGAMATPRAIFSSFSFFGSLKPPKIKMIPEERIISRIKYFEDVSGDSFIVRKPTAIKDVEIDMFFSREGLVKARSDEITRRQIGKIKDSLIERAVVVKPDIKKLPKPKSKFKDFQEELNPFRDMPSVKRPSGVSIFKEEIPKPKGKRTPLSKTFGMSPTENIFETSLKRFKKQPITPKKEDGIIMILKPIKEKVTKEIPKQVGQQLQILEKPKLKKVEVTQFQVLTKEELDVLEKIKSVKKIGMIEEPSLMNIQSELFPSAEKIKVTRFVEKEISGGKIKPLGIIGEREKELTKELDRVSQPSKIESSTILGTKEENVLRTIFQEGLKQPQIERVKQSEKLKNLSRLIPKQILRKVQIPRQPQKTTIKTTIKTTQRIKLRPKIEIVPKIKLKSLLKEDEDELKIGEELFEIFVRKKGEDIPVGEFKTLPKASKELFKTIREEIRASGFIEKAGKKIKIDLGGTEFIRGKKDSFRIVEPRQRRIKKGTREVFQIQKAKKGRGFFK